EYASDLLGYSTAARAFRTRACVLVGARSRRIGALLGEGDFGSDADPLRGLFRQFLRAAAHSGRRRSCTRGSSRVRTWLGVGIDVLAAVDDVGRRDDAGLDPAIERAGRDAATLGVFLPRLAALVLVLPLRRPRLWRCVENGHGPPCHRDRDESEPRCTNSPKRKSVQLTMCLHRRRYFERLHISLHIVQTAI